MEKQLKAYQVGDNDMVVHYTAEEAAAFLCTYAGYPNGEITADDVELVSEEFLDMPMVEEDGSPAEPLRGAVLAATEPFYLHGWE
jgi:hypothetical protein